MSQKCNVAILGATGLVGQAFLDILGGSKLPLGSLHLLASSDSTGMRLQFAGKDVEVKDAAEFDFSQAHVGLFSAGASVSERYAPKAAKAGCLVIDNTAQFRSDDDVPLVIPEVNGHRISNYRQRNIIANPNCSTIQLLVALKPIYDAVGIKRIHVASYQAVSGIGRDGTESLIRESADVLSGKDTDVGPFPKRIAFNVIPQAGDITADGHTEEELKLVRETHKIMEDTSIEVVATCARVPVFNGHSEAVHIETAKPLSTMDALELLRAAPGVRVADSHEDGGYQTVAELGSDSDYVCVGRVRTALFGERGLCMWVVGDNVRKGAALNSVQIAEYWWDKFS